MVEPAEKRVLQSGPSRTAWFFIGLALGLLCQYFLLAFGLHVSLVLARVTGDCAGCYCAALGSAMVLGIALGILSTPWAGFWIRALVASLLVLMETLAGGLSARPA